jgi:hypothetical protein
MKTWTDPLYLHPEPDYLQPDREDLVKFYEQLGFAMEGVKAMSFTLSLAYKGLAHSKYGYTEQLQKHLMR